MDSGDNNGRCGSPETQLAAAFLKINLYFVFFLFFFFLAVSLVEFNPPAAAAPLTSTH